MKDTIKRALKEKNISQKELAEKLYVTPQAVSKRISGESFPTTENILRMGEIFGPSFKREFFMKGVNFKKNMNNYKDLKELNTSQKVLEEADNIIEKSKLYGYSGKAITLARMYIIKAIYEARDTYLRALKRLEEKPGATSFYDEDDSPSPFLNPTEIVERNFENVFTNIGYALEFMDEPSMEESFEEYDGKKASIDENEINSLLEKEIEDIDEESEEEEQLRLNCEYLEYSLKFFEKYIYEDTKVELSSILCEIQNRSLFGGY